MTSRAFPIASGARVAIAVSLCISLTGCGRHSAPAQTLTLLAPASPGGGWDQTARVMQQVLRSAGLTANAQVVNVPGAGGVIGLAQVVNARQGDPNLIMVTGLIMMGAILTNNSAVTMAQVTPLARLLGEYGSWWFPRTRPTRLSATS